LGPDAGSRNQFIENPRVGSSILPLATMQLIDLEKRPTASLGRGAHLVPKRPMPTQHSARSAACHAPHRVWRHRALASRLAKGRNNARWRNELTSRLLRADPGESEDFAVTASLFRTELERYFMADPHPERYDQINYIRFYVYGGFTFPIKVYARQSVVALQPYLLDANAPFVIALRGLSRGARH
jgi:hypothetical protein